jgi:hypothetical protein
MNFSDRHIAGHQGAFKFTEDNALKNCKQSELEFYERLQNNPCEHDIEFMTFLPKYYGHNKNYIILENLQLNREFSSVLDVKIGKFYMMETNNKNIDKKYRLDRITCTHQNNFRFSGVGFSDQNG